MPDSFDGFCSLWRGANPGVRMRGMHLPTSHFQNAFNVHNFSMVLNLFGSNKIILTPGMHNQKCADKMHHV